jgi:hypothetical protein
MPHYVTSVFDIVSLSEQNKRNCKPEVMAFLHVVDYTLNRCKSNSDYKGFSFEKDRRAYHQI